MENRHLGYQTLQLIIVTMILSLQRKPALCKGPQNDSGVTEALSEHNECVSAQEHVCMGMCHVHGPLCPRVCA